MSIRDKVTTWSDTALEATVLDSISLDTPWSIVEDFSKIVRLSGSPEERAAVDLLIGKLTEWGVPYMLHEPEAFISIPLAASVRLEGENGKTFRAKTPAMSISTGDEAVSGELVYVPSDEGGAPGDVFATGVQFGGVNVRGKIVMTEGFASPGKIHDVVAAGAIAGIFINPGTAIHEGICTTIWGTPDLDNQADQPSIPVVAINKPDGEELIAAAKGGAMIAVQTLLDTAWRTIPILVAEIPGAVAPDEFVLLNGHLDSWHVGVGDNATGNATMLELARVFWQNRDSLGRSLKIAWWSGHSHGRYAGSTWFADQFAIELAKDCVAQVNCDSPGCRWAETFNELSAMSETESFVDTVIRSTTRITPQTERPPRAGDYSFNGIGLTSFYMLSSTMSDELRAEKNYYAVGGCGANIEWHTEGDTIEIADADILLRDMKVYAASILRVLNAGATPFDFTGTTAEFRATLAAYQDAAGEAFSFAPAVAALDDLDAALQGFYGGAPIDASPGDETARRFSYAQRRLARLLVPVNFSRVEAFRHDPALGVPKLPDLAPALSYPAIGDDVARRGVLRAHLTRGQNRLVWALVQAREVVDAASA
jgi:hypothetical protein